MITFVQKRKKGKQHKHKYADNNWTIDNIMQISISIIILGLTIIFVLFAKYFLKQIERILKKRECI